MPLWLVRTNKSEMPHELTQSAVEQHLALVMEYAACGSLTSYVAEQWQRAQHSGLFLSEDEARYFFRVTSPPLQRRVTPVITHATTFLFGDQSMLLLNTVALLHSHNGLSTYIVGSSALLQVDIVVASAKVLQGEGHA